jgi:hypothetical protein
VRWLLDEMLPQAAARELEVLGHDAISVVDVDLRGVEDGDVFEYAAAERRIVVTENFADYATLVEQRQHRHEPCVPVVFVRKSAFSPGGALPSRLAEHSHAWALTNPEPFEGLHWP